MRERERERERERDREQLLQEKSLDAQLGDFEKLALFNFQSRKKLSHREFVRQHSKHFGLRHIPLKSIALKIRTFRQFQHALNAHDANVLAGWLRIRHIGE